MFVACSGSIISELRRPIFAENFPFAGEEVSRRAPRESADQTEQIKRIFDFRLCVRLCVERDKIKLNWMKPKRIFYGFTRRVINAIRNGRSFGSATARKSSRTQYRRRRDKPMQFDGRLSPFGEIENGRTHMHALQLPIASFFGH